MKHTNRTIPTFLFAFVSALMVWPQSALAQTTKVNAPQDVSLDVLECAQNSDSQATLSWEKQIGASEYRIYTRLGEDEFGAYEATTSAKIKLPLDSKDISIIAITSVEKTQSSGKTETNESEKSPEFEVDVPGLCEKVSPTNTITPEPTQSASSVSVAPSKTIDEEPKTNEKPLTEVDPSITPADENLAKLEKKYTESKKNQAQIEKKVQSFVNWFKSTIAFWN